MQRQGFNGTGLNQIVAEANAPKGSLYFHFARGKEQLAAEAIARSGAYVETALADHAGASAVESLDAYLLDVAAQLERSGYLNGCSIATSPPPPGTGQPSSTPPSKAPSCSPKPAARSNPSPVSAPNFRPCSQRRTPRLPDQPTNRIAGCADIRFRHVGRDRRSDRE